LITINVIANQVYDFFFKINGKDSKIIIMLKSDLTFSMFFTAIYSNKIHKLFAPQKNTENMIVYKFQLYLIVFSKLLKASNS